MLEAIIIIAIIGFVALLIIPTDNRTEAEKKADNGDPRVRRIFQICVGGNVVDRNELWIEFQYQNAHAVLVAAANLENENFELSELHGKGLRVYI